MMALLLGAIEAPIKAYEADARKVDFERETHK
jgi:hypothetical protein